MIPSVTADVASEFRTDAARWRALERREASAEGRFVYGVRTTGVYCRPTCRSRLPRRQNAEFFATAPEAEAAGYRACLRCRPGEAAEARPAHWQSVVRACRRLASGEEASLAELAAEAGLSRFHFQRVFKDLVGVTPKQFAAGRRLERLRRSLADREGTVTQAVYAAGFNSAGRAHAAAARGLGMSLRAYRGGGEEMEIRYAVAGTSLGRVIVAATERGVCAIEMGDSDEALMESLRKRFPAARIGAGGREFAAVVRRVVKLVESPGSGGAERPELPLDLRGTAFQVRVWEALRGIGAGETVSYAELARRLGRPGAARAVAGACAANKVAIAVPCHRVVRGDGSLSGYRWGVERKRALLEREKASGGDRK